MLFINHWERGLYNECLEELTVQRFILIACLQLAERHVFAVTLISQSNVILITFIISRLSHFDVIYGKII